jgi:glycosyl transferase family 2
MRLVMTMVVRDEADVLEANLEHHLRQGVDLVLVTDHASEDATPDILDRHARAGTVRVFREGADTLDQASWVTRMARLAAVEHAADWVLHSDADEFWLPIAGTLKAVLAAVPPSFGRLAVPRRDFIPRPGDEPFHERMVVRERESHNRRGDPLEPKAAHRGVPDVEIDHGNHTATAPGLGALLPVPVLEILHFPVRSYNQFERKVVRSGLGYEALESRPPDVGRDQLELLEIQRGGALREHYARATLSSEEIEAGLDAGRLIVDRRLALSLDVDGAREGPATASPEDTAAMDLLEHVLAALDRGVATERDLEATRHELEEARADLEALRNSRLVRLTRPARTLYYRLRGH